MRASILHRHSIKKEILKFLESNDGAFYGDIVRTLRYPNHTLLKNVLELKEEGIIVKDSDGGKYKLNI